SVVSIAWQLVRLERRLQRFAYVLFEIRHVEQVSLVEPNDLARLRMRSHRLSHLACAQPIAVEPFKIDRRLAAVFFNLSAIGGLKRRLPRKIDLRSVVACVHDLLLDESLQDLRIEILINLAAVGDRRLTTRERRFRTEEADPHGPTHR